MNRTLGVLLAGGRGARLGLDVPKGLVRVRGTTLLARALETLARVSHEIVVATPPALDLPLPSAVGERRVPVRRVTDRAPGGGPLAGLVAALLEGAFARACVLGVDFPFITAATLDALLAKLDPGGAGGPAAVVPAPDGVLQPLAAAYAPSSVGALASAFERGERSVVRAVESLDPLVLGPAALADLPGGADGFFNLNTPEDLAAAERRLQDRVGSR